MKNLANKVGQTKDMKEAQALTNSILIRAVAQLSELKVLFAQFIEARMKLLYQKHQLSEAQQEANESETDHFGRKKNPTMAEQWEQGWENMGKVANERHAEACEGAAKYGFTFQGC